MYREERWSWTPLLLLEGNTNGQLLSHRYWARSTKVRHTSHLPLTGDTWHFSSSALRRKDDCTNHWKEPLGFPAIEGLIHDYRSNQHRFSVNQLVADGSSVAASIPNSVVFGHHSPLLVKNTFSFSFFFFLSEYHRRLCWSCNIDHGDLRERINSLDTRRWRVWHDHQMLQRVVTETS